MTLSRYLPILTWARTYDRDTALSDGVAAAIVASRPVREALDAVNGLLEDFALAVRAIGGVGWRSSAGGSAAGSGGGGAAKRQK